MCCVCAILRKSVEFSLSYRAIARICHVCELTNVPVEMLVVFPTLSCTDLAGICPRRHIRIASCISADNHGAHDWERRY